MNKRETQIYGNIQILWERGWPTTPENVKRMCANGGHLLISPQEAEQVIESIDPGQKEAWLSRFPTTQAPGHTDAEWAGRYAAWLSEPEWKPVH